METKPSQPVEQEEVLAPLQHRWLWFQEKRAYGRLLRELETFCVDLAALEKREKPEDKSWAKPAHRHLENAQRHLKKRDIEGAWVCLHAARRQAVFGLNDEELANRARILKRESEKVLSWRGKAMQDLLRSESITATTVAKVMWLRDEYDANVYHKVWLIGDQLVVLIGVCGVAFVVFVVFMLFICRYTSNGASDWSCRTVAEVLLFGLLGAGLSAARSLVATGTNLRIPQRVANLFVTVTRVLFGAVAGLAGYAFYDSRLLNIAIGEKVGSFSAGLAIAFAFGFGGERLVARVANSLTNDKGSSTEEAGN